MKYLYITSLLLVLGAVPLTSLAHGSDGDTPNVGMMTQVEDEAVGDEVHAEMEDLMDKMMSGTMSDEETTRMVELMQEYPGTHASMMNRMMDMDDSGHMGESGYIGSFGFSNTNSVANWITQILLWIFMALGIAVFWKSLQKEKITS